jgi:predicted PurR-regulated permease PerM
VITVVASATALYLLYLVRQPISYILLALFIAVATSPLVGGLSRRMRKGYAIAIVYTGILVLPIVIVWVLIAPLLRSAAHLVNNLPEWVQKIEDDFNSNPQLKDLNEKYHLTDKLASYADDAVRALGDAAGNLVSLGAGVVSSIFALVTILVLSMFMVARGRSWVEALLRTRPEHEADAARRALDGMVSAVSGYIGGALLQAFCAGFASFILLVILGVPSPFVLGVLMALFDLIPLVGATIGAVIVGVATLFADPPLTTLVWTIFAIAYQQFENYVIQPRIQSRAATLDPFIVVISAMFGGALLGVAGALLAIPVAAAIRVALIEFMNFRREVGAARGGAADTSGGGRYAPLPARPPE